MSRDFFIGRQSKAEDFALDGKQWVKRTSCWRELALSHLIQHKPSAAYSQKKNLSWPSLTPHTKPERPWRQWINCSPLSLIHHILNRNELQAQNCCGLDYKRPKRGILFKLCTVNKNKHSGNVFFLIGLTLKKRKKQRSVSSQGCICRFWHLPTHTGELPTHRLVLSVNNNTGLKQRATEENFLELPSPLHRTCLGKTADEKYHPLTSPHAEII